MAERIKQSDKFHFSRFFRKKPHTVEAMQMDDDFIVVTLEGEMEGHRGDYLVKGMVDELYPVKCEIFETTYDEIAPD